MKKFENLNVDLFLYYSHLCFHIAAKILRKNFIFMNFVLG